MKNGDNNFWRREKDEEQKEEIRRWYMKRLFHSITGDKWKEARKKQKITK